jgi:putative Holliday junction resolvase
MGRLMAIDFGQKRVGVAVTDPLQIIANGLDTVPSTSIWEFLEQYLTNEQVDCFIVGYPKRLNNENSDSVKFVDPFIKKLKKKYPTINVELYDERFTSKMAFQAMIDGGLKKKQRQNKALIDKISATIILQNYLDSLKR